MQFVTVAVKAFVGFCAIAIPIDIHYRRDQPNRSALVMKQGTGRQHTKIISVKSCRPVPVCHDLVGRHSRYSPAKVHAPQTGRPQFRA